jgi:hypothetical protein
MKFVRARVCDREILQVEAGVVAGEKTVFIYHVRPMR